jgi:hypothetical protein
MTEQQGLSLYFGDWLMPIDLTTIKAEERGTLLDMGRRDFKFMFRYRELPISVHFVGDHNKADATITIALGRLPFSAESATQRAALGEIGRGMNKHFGSIVSSPRGRMQVKKKLPLTVPVTATSLLSDLTKFLYPLKPYFDLMAMVRMLD